jgi:nitrogen regulatory protein PII
MPHVTVIVKPFKLDEVVEALAAFPLEGLVIDEVRGYGRQKGHLELYSGSEYSITFLPKMRIEFAAEEARLPAILRAVEDAAKTGRIGDGKVFVRAVARTVAIGEEGAA